MFGCFFRLKSPRRSLAYSVDDLAHSICVSQDENLVIYTMKIARWIACRVRDQHGFVAHPGQDPVLPQALR